MEVPNVKDLFAVNGKCVATADSYCLLNFYHLNAVWIKFIWIRSDFLNDKAFSHISMLFVCYIKPELNAKQ